MLSNQLFLQNDVDIWRFHAQLFRPLSNPHLMWDEVTPILSGGQIVGGAKLFPMNSLNSAWIHAVASVSRSIPERLDFENGEDVTVEPCCVPYTDGRTRIWAIQFAKKSGGMGGGRGIGGAYIYPGDGFGKED